MADKLSPELTEAQRASQQLSAVSSDLESTKRRLAAAEALLGESAIQARRLKMERDHYLKTLNKLRPIENKYELAKSAITELANKVKALLPEANLRQAAEALLSKVLKKLEGRTKDAFVTKLLAKESMKVQESLRPMLMRCANKQAVTEVFNTFRTALRETRNEHGKIPITESGQRKAQITESPLLRDNGNGNKPREKKYLNEEHKTAVNLSNALVARTAGRVAKSGEPART